MRGQNLPYGTNLFNLAEVLNVSTESHLPNIQAIYKYQLTAGPCPCFTFLSFKISPKNYELVAKFYFAKSPFY